MKKYLILLALITTAEAADIQRLSRAPKIEDEALNGLYLRGDISAGTMTQSAIGTSSGRTMALGGGIGYRYSWFRGEIAADYHLKSGANPVTNLTFLANGYADLGQFYGFTPYFGLGVGMGQTQFQTTSKNHLATAFHLGTSYAINKSLDIDLGYRALMGLYRAHEIRLGLRFNLN